MSQDFLERLGSLTAAVEGSMGAALVGLDGIPVESLSQGLDSVDAGAEYAAILGDAQKASQDLDLGQIRGLSILTDRMRLLFSLLKSEYFLMLAVENLGNWGKARYRLSDHTRKLEEEM
jgi:predicted regulator of Ras-like GTPase activity (Roadblock/LC7/MglB family)